MHFHPRLNALPTDANGNFLDPHTRPLPRQPLDPQNPFAPFESRLAFDWGHYHFVENKSSAAKINKGLDLWLASRIEMVGSENCGELPWASAEDLYATIDSINNGSAPFETVHFRYNGPKPPNPPSWMTDTFELCLRDVREVIHQQMATPDFAHQFNTAPYQEFFVQSGDRVWSNFFSGDWAWREADKVAQDPTTHGSMLLPVISGLDKTTVSVATGHQEYHPFYISPANLTNEARRGHGNGVIPVAFLPIPKGIKRQKKRKEYKCFVRQLYHACIARIFAPLKAGMLTPEVVLCPDNHYRRAIYSIGPIIADYPEQVWLACIIQGWCPKCLARPENLDDPKARPRTREKTQFMRTCFNLAELRAHGVREGVVPFTDEFPRADIYELIAPDLLHQVIKGTFKDHLVEWINDYIYAVHPESKALEIIQDIDRRVSAVPIYPGLRRFKDGRDFKQWTGDDSKALMKVYISAIVGYVPDEMVECLASFMEVCYVFRRNAITTSALDYAKANLADFHNLREIFVSEGIRTHCSLPRQHALSHFIRAIMDFGAPNGLCSSITESRHISAVKEPWRRSNRNDPLPQMLCTIVRLDKIGTLRRELIHHGKLEGTTAMYMAMETGETDGDHSALDEDFGDVDMDEDAASVGDDELDDRGGDVAPVAGPRLASSVSLARTRERGYPRDLFNLSLHLGEPEFRDAFLTYLYQERHPNLLVPTPINEYIHFQGNIFVYHSAVARFYAPSDACGVGGMHRQVIRSNPSWYNRARMDTAFISQDDTPGMGGMMVAQIRLFFSFVDPQTNVEHACALVNWFPVVGEEPDPVTGMWRVQREEIDNVRPLQVIPLASIVRGAHLLPVFGNGRLPEGFCYTDSLEAFEEFYVNSYIDYHTHELLSVE
ncbi:hypothetical protein CC2G_003523 [Coprinopsis cinerea AmutBmut pab1-1]|nr:hypothetical protein CC2G_003523 [Coprinopsis cinerea AmutBmut pab1-1]